MLETQGYKKHQGFTIPREGMDIAYVLFSEHLAAIVAVMDDPGAERYFSKNEWVAMGFQRLMLAQMIARMDRGMRDA